MAKGENVELSTVEVRPKSGSGNDSITDGIVPPQWPSQPRPLTAAPVAEHTLDVFDGILCAIPLLLIAKIALILVAFRKDRGATGYFADTASSMTVYLIKFNHQVSLVDRALAVPLTSLACHAVYHLLCVDHHHPGPSPRPVPRPEKCNYRRARALSSSHLPAWDFVGDLELESLHAQQFWSSLRVGYVVLVC